MDYTNHTISTFSDQSDVMLYRKNSDNTMTRIKNRALGKGTTWFTDEKMTINGDSYYRVSTNEWAKIDEAYIYESINRNINTYGGAYKTLVDAEGHRIRNRALSPNTSWYSDRITYINGEKYYRVATNGFVNVNNIY